MSKIKVAELFYSIQGEGRYQGVPSVFLRTFGCNFKCRGFGRELSSIPNDESYNPEVEFVIKQIANYKEYNELPLVSTGCDSYASVYPEFKHLSPMLTVDAIVERTMEILPFNEWRKEHLVITGGEPLLGWQRSYPALLNHPKMDLLTEVTFETNGTQELSDGFADYLINWQNDMFDREVTFSVSPKLPCSGEKFEDAIKPNIIMSYARVGYTYLKFVIATEQDFADAERAIDAYWSAGFKGDIYLMPVGGVESVYALNNKTVALLAMKNGLRYSDRLQVPLFKNAWNT